MIHADATAGTWQRVGPLSALPAILRDLHADPGPILLAAGLPSNSLDDPDALIPYAAMGQLLDASVHLANVPLIGLLVGQRARAEQLGLVGRLMRNAPALGDAIVDLVAHHQRYVRGGIPVFINSSEAAILTYTIYDEGVVAIDQIYDGTLAAGCAIFRELTGQSPAEVRLRIVPRMIPLHTAASSMRRSSSTASSRLSCISASSLLRRFAVRIRRIRERLISQVNGIGGSGNPISLTGSRVCSPQARSGQPRGRKTSPAACRCTRGP